MSALISVRLSKPQLDFIEQQKYKGIYMSKSFQYGLDMLQDAIRCDCAVNWRDEKKHQFKDSIDDGRLLYTIQVSVSNEMAEFVDDLSKKEKVSKMVIVRKGLELYWDFIES